MTIGYLLSLKPYGDDIERIGDASTGPDGRLFVVHMNHGETASGAFLDASKAVHSHPDHPEVDAWYPLPIPAEAIISASRSETGHSPTAEDSRNGKNMGREAFLQQTLKPGTPKEIFELFGGRGVVPENAPYFTAAILESSSAGTSGTPLFNILVQTWLEINRVGREIFDTLRASGLIPVHNPAAMYHIERLERIDFTWNGETEKPAGETARLKLWVTERLVP